MNQLTSILAFISAHQTLLVYILIAMAYSLPVPGDSRPLRAKVYSFLYDTSHALANRGKPPVTPPSTGEIK